MSKHLDAAVMSIIMLTLSLWSAALASNVTGSAWVALTLLTVALFLAALAFGWRWSVTPRRAR